jgi:RimJ/RimL family protein N-acetyltransferase
MTNLHPHKLIGEFITLEPFHLNHREELRPISQEENIWTFYTYSLMHDKFDPWFDKTLHKAESGEEITFVVRRQQDQKVVGTSRFYDISLADKRLVGGHTWYSEDARGTVVNPETALLMMTYAFEILKINRVEITVDSRNTRSLAATKKLGAVQEGILRQHKILENGYVRDTVLFSILQSEWPAVKKKLISRLSAFDTSY